MISHRLIIFILIAFIIGIITLFSINIFGMNEDNIEAEFKENILSEYEYPPSYLSPVDKLIGEFILGTIAFDTPLNVNINDNEIVQLKLGSFSSLEELKNKLYQKGDLTSDKIYLADIMEAKLYGRNFTIDAITPETQAVSRNMSTEWMWTVYPHRHGGQQKLYLTVSVLLNINGITTPRMIEMYVRTINVDITLRQRVVLFYLNNWQFIWAIILLPIVTMLWNQWRIYKNNTTITG